MANVEVAMESPLSADDVVGSGFAHVVVATGARWRADAVGRGDTSAIEVDPRMNVLTPDGLMSGERPVGQRVVVFDDDHYYMGGVLAELLAGEGFEVTLVTPAAQVSSWTNNTLEILRVQRRVLGAGVDVRTALVVTSIGSDAVSTANAYTGATGQLPADAVVLVTARLPEEGLLLDLVNRSDEWAASGMLSVRAIGDAFAPATIAAAVYEGHKYAEELDTAPRTGDFVPFRREVTALVDEERNA